MFLKHLNWLNRHSPTVSYVTVMSVVRLKKFATKKLPAASVKKMLSDRHATPVRLVRSIYKNRIREAVASVSASVKHLAARHLNSSGLTWST